MSEVLKKYLELRTEIDDLSNKLHQLHEENMQCKKGCDLCCMDYQIFPIELESIRQAIQDKHIETTPSKEGSCIFLKNHVCQIYEHRPIICRTHGLPLLFMNNDQWELSACELNFTEFDDNNFTSENTFPQDKFNSQLFMLNKEYIKETDNDKSEFELIPLREVLQSK
jgi:Fe-S-cluster containining protein